MRTIYVILDWPDLQKKQLVEFFDLLCETALVNLVDQFRVHSAPPEAARRSPPKLHLNLAEGGRIARKISQNMRRPCGRRDCLSSWDRRLPAARGLLTTAESVAELRVTQGFAAGVLRRFAPSRMLYRISGLYQSPTAPPRSCHSLSKFPSPCRINRSMCGCNSASIA